MENYSGARGQKEQKGNPQGVTSAKQERGQGERSSTKGNEGLRGVRELLCVSMW